MRIPAIIALLTALAFVPGCTSVTHIHYHGDEGVGGKPPVVHDTVYVEQGPTPPGGTLVPAPDTLTAPVPEDPLAPLTGRVSWIEALDPGTASVETVIDYDLGITTHRMMGNLLSNSGLRFELNVMVSLGASNGVEEYWLIPEFISPRNWDAESTEAPVQASGRPASGTVIRTDPAAPGVRSDGSTRGRKEVSGRPGAPVAETDDVRAEDEQAAEVEIEAVILPSLLLRLDGEPSVFDDMDDYDCEPHTTMLYGVTVRIPVSAATIEALASGTYGSVEIRDLGGNVIGTLTRANFTNFRSFLAL